MNEFLDIIIEYAYIIPAALVAIVLHELGHALVSYWLGDPTPKNTGRLTLNPARHLDPWGTLCLIFFHFGWAKPVMINPSYYKKPKVGMTIVGLAGPLMNFILVIFSFLVIGTTLAIQVNFGIGDNVITTIIYKFFEYLAYLNIGLGVFNLIPIPPLDGSKIIGIVLPDKAYHEYMGFQKYGMLFMIILIGVFYILENLGYSSPLGIVIDSVFEFFYRLVYRIILR